MADVLSGLDNCQFTRGGVATSVDSRLFRGGVFRASRALAPMSTEHLFHVVLSIVMGLASTVFWFWARDQATFRTEVERRFHDAGKETSKLASTIQGLVGLEVSAKVQEEQIAEIRRRLERLEHQ